MKLNRIILISAIAVLAIFISTMLFAAQVMKKVERQAAMPAQQRELITSCYEASNLTLSQKDLENLQIVSSVFTDPYCCNKNYLSEVRLDCLKNNWATLDHILRMLHKIRTDIQSKCYHKPAWLLEEMICEVPQVGSQSAKIHEQANCVKEIIDLIGDQYDALTQCPNK